MTDRASADFSPFLQDQASAFTLRNAAQAERLRPVIQRQERAMSAEESRRRERQV